MPCIAGIDSEIASQLFFIVYVMDSFFVFENVKAISRELMVQRKFFYH